jgi:HEAT repeat protein
MQWWHAQRLKSRNAQARREAIDKLSEHPSVESLRLIVPLLSDPVAEVRKAAIRALGKAREAQYLPQLLQSLGDTATEVRISVVAALRQIGDLDATEALVTALRDKNPAVRARAASALEKFGWKPRTTEESAMRAAALGDFLDAAKGGLPVLDMLIKTLAQGTSTNKREAVEALGSIGGAEVVPVLLTALEDEDFSVRVAALEVLKDVIDPRALQPLTNSLKHTDAGIRTAAATALAFYGPEAIPVLTRCLNDKNWSVRRAVVEGLGRSKDPGLADQLLPRLKDSDHDVREATCAALARLRSHVALTPLILTLTDSQTSVRQAAAIALREIHPEWETLSQAKEALPALRDSLQDREYWVRQAAREAIERIESASQVSSRIHVIDEKLGAAINILASLLKHPQRDFRLAAVEALGRFGNPQLQPVLVSVANDNDRWVRQAVQKALKTSVDIWGAAA